MNKEEISEDLLFSIKVILDKYISLGFDKDDLIIVVSNCYEDMLMFKDTKTVFGVTLEFKQDVEFNFFEIKTKHQIWKRSY